MAVGWRIGTLALLGVLCLPSAAAWTISVEVGDYPKVIAPETELSSIPVTVTIHCETHDVASTEAMVLSYAASVAMEQATTTTVSISPETHESNPCPYGTTEKRFSVTLIVIRSRDAPAMQPARITFNATARQDFAAGTQERSVTSDMEVAPNYYVRMSYVPTTYIQRVLEDQRADFPVTMTNLGNGPVRVSTLEESNFKAGTGAVVPPVDQVLLSKPTHPDLNNSATVNIQVWAPRHGGIESQFYRIEARFLAVPDDASSSSSLGSKDEQAVILSLEVRGSGLAASSANLLTVVAGLFVAAILRSRRR